MDDNKKKAILAVLPFLVVLSVVLLWLIQKQIHDTKFSVSERRQVIERIGNSYMIHVAANGFSATTVLADFTVLPKGYLEQQYPGTELAVTNCVELITSSGNFMILASPPSTKIIIVQENGNVTDRKKFIMYADQHITYE